MRGAAQDTAPEQEGSIRAGWARLCTGNPRVAMFCLFGGLGEMLALVPGGGLVREVRAGPHSMRALMSAGEKCGRFLGGATSSARSFSVFVVECSHPVRWSPHSMREVSKCVVLLDRCREVREGVRAGFWAQARSAGGLPGSGEKCAHRHVRHREVTPRLRGRACGYKL